MMWLLFALSSAFLSAAAAVIQKKVLFRMTALEFSFSVSVLILFLSLLMPFSVDVVSLPSSTLVLIVGKSALGAFAFLLVMMSLEKNQISSALPLLGLTPAAAAFLSMPALGESLRQWEWIAIGMMMAGTYLIEHRSSNNNEGAPGERMRLRSQYPIIGAVVLFAVSSVTDKLLVSGYKIHPLAVLFYQHIVYCCIFGIMLAVRVSLVRRSSQRDSRLSRSGPSDAAPGTHVRHPGGASVHQVPAPASVPSLRPLFRTVREQLPFIAAVALITIAYRFAQLEAVKDAPAALVLAVKRTSIVFASFYGGRLFSEENLLLKLIGATLIAGSGFLILRFIA